MKTRYLIASLTSLAFVGTAAAQGEPAPDAGGDATAGAPAADPTAAPATTAAPEAAAPATRYPENIIDRPLTYPKGVAAVGVDIATFTSSFFDPAFIRILGGYGITDDFEINFGHYAFPTSDVGKGSIDVGLGYKLLRGAAGGKLEAIARVQTGYSLLAKDLKPLGLGVHVQYNVTPKIALITPGGQLQFGLAGDKKPITFGLPVSVGFQAAPKLYAQLDTTLATFKIANSATTIIGSDTTPIALTVYYTPKPAIDVFAGLSFDATPPDVVVGTTTTSGSVGDTLAILVGGRYYIGKL